MVLVLNIGISTSISNTTQMHSQQLKTSWVSTGNVGGASAKYWYQHQHIQHYPNTTTALQKLHVCPLGMYVDTSAKYQYLLQHIQHYTNTPTALPKLHVCPLGMYVVLVPNIGISTRISNTTQIRPQHFRKVMCVHWECACCQCQILVLAPTYPTLHKYAHSTSESSCVSTGNVRGASAKYWYQHQRIQHYTNTPTVVKKLHVCPLGMYVVLVPNIGICTSISNTTQIRPQHLRNFMCVHWECTWILVPNIGICNSISNTTQIRPQHFRNFMCVHWECAWCQCQILVLAPAYPTLHKYAHRSSETSCVHWECAWCQC